MLKNTKLIIIISSIILSSCSISSTKNDSNEDILENIDKDMKSKVEEKYVSFDNIIKCNGDELFNFDNGYFYYPDYGCTYSESNQLGDVQVFLFPKDKKFIPNSLSEYDSIIDEVNELSVNEIKHNFDIFVRVIDKSDLVFTKDLDYPYYIKDNPKKLVYYFDGMWKLIDTKDDIDQDPLKFYSDFFRSLNKGSKKINSKEIYQAKNESNESQENKSNEIMDVKIYFDKNDMETLDKSEYVIRQSESYDSLSYSINSYLDGASNKEAELGFKTDNLGINSFKIKVEKNTALINFTSDELEIIDPEQVLNFTYNISRTAEQFDTVDKTEICINNIYNYQMAFLANEEPIDCPFSFQKQ